MQFATAFNRQDAAAAAALFSEDGIRVTPQGIIQGRDAIQKDSDKRFQSRFHDLSITPLIARGLSDEVWEAGEWTMKIGDQSIRGYLAMALVTEDCYQFRVSPRGFTPVRTGHMGYTFPLF